MFGILLPELEKKPKDDRKQTIKLMQTDPEKSNKDAIEHVWYMRPVFFVSDI